MLINQNSNATILSTAVLNFNMKTVFETLERLLFNQHTKCLYNIANYLDFLHVQILCKMSEFCDIPTKHTVKYIACSLKWYINYVCVLNVCEVIHF